MTSIKYFHTYLAHVKFRWRNRSLIDVLSHEFVSRSREYYIKAIEVGAVTVNNNIVHPDFILGDSDIIRQTLHIHEPTPPNIDVLNVEEDYVVVNKPSGIPCHPTGGYFMYSVTKALFNDKKVGCVNRLDMPVSGVLILTFNNAHAIHTRLDDAKKLYVAKVKGVFPDYIEVDKPIGSKGRIYGIDDAGKPSKTIFTLLSTNGEFSLVQCQPITGRTHQIRIHLKYLGFPVINDILYGDGKVPGIIEEDCYRCDEKYDENNCKEKLIITNCKGECNRTFQMMNQFICLHAWKYIFNDKVYEAKWPFWAKLDDN